MSLEDEYGPTPAESGHGPHPVTMVRETVGMVTLILIGATVLGGPWAMAAFLPIYLPAAFMLWRATGGE